MGKEKRVKNDTPVEDHVLAARAHLFAIAYHPETPEHLAQEISDLNRELTRYYKYRIEIRERVRIRRLLKLVKGPTSEEPRHRN